MLNHVSAGTSPASPLIDDSLAVQALDVTLRGRVGRLIVEKDDNDLKSPPAV